MSDNEEEVQKPVLARWTDIVQPASLSTKTGAQRFLVTVKLPEKSLKTASSFVREMNDALQARGRGVDAQIVLVDSERTRLQRAIAGFSTFKEAQTCLNVLAELGLKVSPISAELEDFGTKQYDPWLKRMASSWWPWFAKWSDPAPEMPMMKVTNRLDLTEGSKYRQGAGGKLGMNDEEDRREPPPERPADDDEDRTREEPSETEARPERKKRRKKRE